jgi:WD40 repeat protein/tRNA A-37 threonylcarbamoyl transferase component Bud32
MSDSSAPPPRGRDHPDPHDERASVGAGSAAGAVGELRQLLERAEDLTPAQVVDVMCADQQTCWLRGERIPAETYLHMHRAVQDSDEDALDLIYAEILLREELGEPVAIEEYERRFPRFADQLRLQLALHRGLESGPARTGGARGMADPRHGTTIDEEGAGRRTLPRIANWPAVPGYEILGELGRGGMGVVYKARQVRLNRPCALKMILAGDYASSEANARFLAEAETVARLRHPNIVQIHHIGDHDGRTYFELEFLEGGSLADRLDGTPWPPRAAASLVETLARAMHEAHRQGIVHRDLKPGNVLLAGDGTPKVADFGLAKILSVDTWLTRTESIMGSPSYMAPEQAAGQSRKVGPAADVYALGAIFYVLLTGRPPFAGETVLETLDQMRTQEPVVPSKLEPRLPRDLETICLKCLRKEPEARYAGAEALAEDLRRWRVGEPIAARPVGRVERLWRWCRRNPAVAVLAAGVAVSVLLGVVEAWYVTIQASKGHQHASRADREAKRAQASEARASSERLRSDRNRYAAEIHLAFQAWRDGQAALAEKRLDDLAPATAAAADLRGFEWFYLKNLCHLDGRTLDGYEAPVRGLAFSGDGKLLVSGGGGYDPESHPWPGEVKVWDVALGRATRTLRDLAAPVLGVALSPDGERIATAGSEKAITLWDARTGTKLQALHGHAAAVLGVAFSPDGERLASAGEDQTVRIWDATGGKLLFTLHGHSMSVLDLAYSPDGRVLATAGGDETVWVWNAVKGKALRTLRGHTGAVRGVTFSPDGSRLASAGGDHTVRLWDAAGGQTVRTLRGHAAPVLGVAFSPDGTLLASASEDRTVKTWDPGTGQELHTLRGHAEAVYRVAFHPDGRLLASAGGDRAVKLWDAISEPEPLTLLGHASPVAAVDFSPDGRRLASAGSDHAVRLWDVETGLEERILRGHVGPVRAVAFRPDGQLLASAGDDQTVRVWDATDGRAGQTLRGHTSFVRSVAFSPDGRRLASAGDDHTVIIWDAIAGRELLTVRGHDQPVRSVTFSPDGAWLASAADDRTVTLWDAASGQEQRTLRGHTGAVHGAVFSPDSRQLASAGGDQTIKVWEVGTGRELLSLKGHAGPVRSVAFSRDGRRLASTSDDQTVKLWDVVSGQELLTVRGHLGPVLGAVFSPDDQRLASASADQTVKVWDAAPPTPERADRREARGVVQVLLDRRLTLNEVLASIRIDTALGDPVRRRALALAEPAWKSRVGLEAQAAVLALLARGLLPAEVLKDLRDQTSLSAPARLEAPVLAGHFPGDPRALNNASWMVVRRPGGKRSEYREALQRAEVACRLVPQNGLYRNTLGVAQYRVGRYSDAVRTLTQSDQLNAPLFRGSIPADLAFRALARHQLGQEVEAQADLRRLRDILKRPEWAGQEEAESLRDEAEAQFRQNAVAATKN